MPADTSITNHVLVHLALDDFLQTQNKFTFFVKLEHCHWELWPVTYIYRPWAFNTVLPTSTWRSRERVSCQQDRQQV